MNTSGYCACAGELLCTRAQFKEDRLEHPALGLLHTCDAFAIVEQPAAGCQAIGKAFDSCDNAQLCPWAFLTGQRIRVGFFCIMHIIEDIWQS